MIDESQEQKRSYGLAIFLGVIIVTAVGIFLWATVFDKGTVQITADAPFTVLSTEGEEYCETSPCEITMKRGVKDLIITKENHQNYSTQIEIRVFKTTEIFVDLLANPFLVKTEKVPTFEEQKYKLVKDQRTQMQKLVAEKDLAEASLANFPKEITDAQIFGSENGALIFDKENSQAYLINFENNSRESVNLNTSEISFGLLSPSAKYFVFSTPDSDNLQILKGKTASSLELPSTNSKFAWNYTDELVYILGLETEYYFYKYNPSQSFYSEFGTFPEITALPQSLIPANNGKMIYVSQGDENYVLTLE